MITPLGAMKIAIEEAKKGMGYVAPNPPVGCVVLDKNGDLLAKGFHRIFGGDHAEIDALKQIQNTDRLKGATVYVTLEPCAHEGQTPSCAKKLATLPIDKVVYGLIDPNKKVSGQGVEILEKAKIQTEQFKALNFELEQLSEVFLWNHRFQKPFVALKVATSLDGQMALHTGESQWITGEESRRQAHRLRAYYDATLIGKETFMRDNPSLNVRHDVFLNHKNKVIILDAKGETLVNLGSSNILKTHGRGEVYVAVSRNVAVSSGGAQIISCEIDGTGRIVLSDMLQKMYSLGIGSVLVEGGARTLSSFLNEGLAQRMYQFIAPHIIGAKGGMNYSKDFEIATMPERRELKCAEFQSFGRDIMVTGRLDDMAHAHGVNKIHSL